LTDRELVCQRIILLAPYVGHGASFSLHKCSLHKAAESKYWTVTQLLDFCQIYDISALVMLWPQWKTRLFRRKKVAL